MLSIVQFYNH